MKQKRQRSASNCADSLSSVSCSSADSVSSSSIYLTKDEIRRKKNRESAERSRLRKLGLIDNLSAQVAVLLQKRAVLKSENAKLRASVAATPRSSAAPACGRSSKAAAVTVAAPEAETDAQSFFDDRSDASTLSSSSNSPYHAVSYPTSELGLHQRFLPSTAYRIGATMAAFVSSTPSHAFLRSGDQMAYSSGDSANSPLCDELFDFDSDLFDFSHSNAL